MPLPRAVQNGTRWEEEDGQLDEDSAGMKWYDEEPVFRGSRLVNPTPRYTDMSAHWVVIILAENITPAGRAARWPTTSTTNRLFLLPSAHSLQLTVSQVYGTEYRRT